VDFPNKILIVKLGSIGDVVNTLPLVNVLKSECPEMKLGWLIEPKSYPIVEGHRLVDRFIIYQRGSGIAAARRVLEEIRAFKPDLVIDLQRILRSSFFTAFSGCRRRLGFDQKRCKEFSWLFTNRKIPPRDPSRHMVLQYLEFAGYLGLSYGDIHFSLSISDHDREVAERLLPGSFIDEGFVVLNIGAAKPANRWPENRWVELSGLVLERTKFALILTGGPQDTALGRSIAELVRNDRMLNCTGRTSLKQLGGLFLMAHAVVSGDTGPMHIASALGTRTIGLFGAADPSRTGPFRHRDLVVSAGVACAPCGKRSCRSMRCMDEITAEMVFKKFSGQKN